MTLSSRTPPEFMVATSRLQISGLSSPTWAILRAGAVKVVPGP